MENDTIHTYSIESLTKPGDVTLAQREASPRMGRRYRENFDALCRLADKRVSATHNAAWVDLAGSKESHALVVLILCFWVLGIPGKVRKAVYVDLLTPHQTSGLEVSLPVLLRPRLIMIVLVHATHTQTSKKRCYSFSYTPYTTIPQLRDASSLLRQPTTPISVSPWLW